VDRLSDLERFGSNPGNLRARTYKPIGLPSGAPLVVVLHGCTQTAADYDHGSGWSYLADRLGFALLFPEQQRSNNPKLCFNWFVPAHVHRGGGEAFSISQMIERLAADIDADRNRIFITGLSAGGAMTSVMLATYPDLFRGGAIIAGLPYASAATVPEALDRMHGRAGPQGQDLDARIRDATPYAGPWPAISIWHGSADETVVPANSEAILRQWLLVHALEETPTRTEPVDGYTRRVWCDSNGREVIEMYIITGMGHGTPLSTRGSRGYGNSGPYMLEANISSTRRIAEFWGLTSSAGVHAEVRPSSDRPESSSRNGVAGIKKMIVNALRAVGLMR
jgi:poly(hydroxyalkanoate) depolymerase family esterase